MNVLVLNCGSSSVKHRLFEMPAEIELDAGAVEGIGTTGGPAGHREALAEVCESVGVAPELIVHRVVHGGDRFAAPAVVDDSVLAAIDELGPLAPLHNPPNAEGIRQARRSFPDAEHVAVFDTAFHQTMPAYASAYAIPTEVARRHAVRRYGFHGTSHRWASERAADLLSRQIEELKTVVLHLGAGASACAVDGGRSIDTSMGMTPVEGLIMATRSGDLDPGVLLYLQRETGMTTSDLDRMLNRESGLRGLAGDGDLRAVISRAEAGESGARIAIEAYVYRIAKQVGAYATALGGLDALVFTAGVGERSPLIRAAVGKRMAFLGVEIDETLNAHSSPADRPIHTKDSQVASFVVAANEELQMAREATAAIDPAV